MNARLIDGEDVAHGRRPPRRRRRPQPPSPPCARETRATSATTRSCSPDAASPKATTCSPCATTTASACSTAPAPSSNEIDTTRHEMITRHRHRSTARRPLRLRRGRPPHPRLRHDDPQGPRRHRRPLPRPRSTTPRRGSTPTRPCPGAGTATTCSSSPRTAAVEERHAAEIERDPLDDLRQAIRRKRQQAHGTRRRRAAADVDARPAPTRTRELRGRLGDGPTDPSWEYRRLSEEHARETALPRRSPVAARHRTQVAPRPRPHRPADPPSRTPRARTSNRRLRDRHRPPRREAGRPRGEARRAHARDADPSHLGARTQHRAPAPRRARSSDHMERGHRTSRHAANWNASSSRGSDLGHGIEL